MEEGDNVVEVESDSIKAITTKNNPAIRTSTIGKMFQTHEVERLGEGGAIMQPS